MAGVGQHFKKLKPYSYNRKYIIIFIIDSSNISTFNEVVVLLKLIHRLHSENIYKCWQDQ